MPHNPFDDIRPKGISYNTYKTYVRMNKRKLKKKGSSALNNCPVWQRPTRRQRMDGRSHNGARVKRKKILNTKLYDSRIALREKLEYLGMAVDLPDLSAEKDLRRYCKFFGVIVTNRQKKKVYIDPEKRKTQMSQNDKNRVQK